MQRKMFKALLLFFRISNVIEGTALFFGFFYRSKGNWYFKSVGFGIGGRTAEQSATDVIDHLEALEQDMK